MLGQDVPVVRVMQDPFNRNGDTPESKISDMRYCEAQGKGRARGGPRKVTEWSFIDGGWWMVDILSLELYTKVGCHPPTHHPPGSLITLD